MAPQFEKVADALNYQHTFLSVDIDVADEDLVDSLMVTSLPTFILFINGKEDFRFVGASMEKLSHLLQRADPEWNTAFSMMSM
jgi:thiol-disulfide isomerase/thioredoxin